MLSRFFSATSRRATIALVLLLSISVTIPAFAQGNSAGNTNRPDRVSQQLLEIHANGGAVTPDAVVASTSVVTQSSEARAVGTVNSVSTATIGEFTFGTTDALQSLATVAGDYVLVDAVASVDGQALLADLQAMGLISGSVFANRVSGWLPIDAVPALQSVANLGYMTASRAERFEGLVDNEAVFGQATDIAESLYGLTGEGLTIGIISDSFDCQQP
ncbi:MAG: hypothetical protein WBC91_01405, partial [Phototrophicaceae bacterium]